MAKAKGIVLDSDFSGTEVNLKIKSGFAVVDDDKDNRKEFFLDRSRPIKVRSEKSMFKNDNYDFYFLTWKSLLPVEFKNVDVRINENSLEKELKAKGITEDELRKINRNISNFKSETGLEPTKFLYREMRPVVIEKNHWAKTELPTMVREVGDMRFLKQLKTYSGGGSSGGGGIGRWGALLLGIAIMAGFIIYAWYSAGVLG